MEEKKTVIWHGGLSALLASDQEAPANSSDDSAKGEPARPSAATRILTLTPELVGERPAFHQRNEGAGTRVLGGWDAAQLQGNEAPAAAPAQDAQDTSFVTRVRPIESVLPELETRALEKPGEKAAEKPASAESTQRVVTARESEKAPEKRGFVASLRDRARGMRERPNLERTLLYGGGGTVMLVALLVRALGTLGVADTPPPVQQAPAIAPRAAIPAPSVQAAPVTLPGSTSAPSARAAVDALARGDYVHAAQLYQELARSVSSPSPYSEAARILARTAARDRRP